MISWCDIACVGSYFLTTSILNIVRCGWHGYGKYSMLLDSGEFSYEHSKQ